MAYNFRRGNRDQRFLLPPEVEYMSAFGRRNNLTVSCCKLIFWNLQPKSAMRSFLKF